MKLKVDATIIGEKKVSHIIEVPNYSNAMRQQLAQEFIKKQYPDKVRRICDISHSEVK